MTSDAQVAALIQRFVAVGLARSASEPEQTVARLNDQIRAGVPLLATDTELRRAMDENTRGQIRDFLAWLVSDSTEIRPAAEAIEFARIVARRGFNLSVLLGVYRFVQQAALSYVIETVPELDADPQLQHRALAALWSRALDWLNVSMERLLDAYAEEREAWLRSAIARRTEMIETILRGESVDVEDASHVLGHRLRAYQTGLVLWADDDAKQSDAIGRLEALASRLAGQLHAPRPLVLPSGPRSVWMWLATDRPRDLRRLSTVGASRAAAGLRVAAGVPAAGVAGFISSHREAVTASRVAALLPRRPVLRYADIELICLISHDLEAVKTFVARELGPLAAVDDATARLRETVQAYLAAGAIEAADQLGVHRNTVRYRLQQAESMLGHPIDQRHLPLELALHCAVLSPALLAPTK
jgi:DNA-binding PucR family transcriptional regulator